MSNAAMNVSNLFTHMVVLPDGLYLKDERGTATWDAASAWVAMYQSTAERVANRFPGARVAKRTITVEIVSG